MTEVQMSIGEVAERAGVRVSAIRYYEQVGLLSKAPRVSGQRRYDGSVLRRLTVIDVAQRAGLSLKEIRTLVEHGNDTYSERLRGLTDRRLPEIDALIARTQQVRQWLEAARSCGCVAIDDCRLFDGAALPGKARDDRPLGHAGVPPVTARRSPS
jgi:MerR family redox-sensitive transcriptional activator SoxR